MATKAGELAKEAQRQFDNCLYSAATFNLWLSTLRFIRVVMRGAPVVLGALASWSILTSSDVPGAKTFVAVAAFLAGLLPALESALKIDEAIAALVPAAAEYTILRDAFRKAAVVSSKKPFADFESEYQALVDRHSQVRSLSLTAPWPMFSIARWKIKKGDYSFDIDTNAVPEV